MTIQAKNDIRCAVCRAEYNSEALRKSRIKDCPHCHTLVPPLKMAHDGYFRANWQDIRVLATYAQRWAIRFDTDKKGNCDAIQALENIIRALDAYQPKGGESLWIKATEFLSIVDERKARKLVGIPSPYYKKHEDK